MLRLSQTSLLNICFSHVAPPQTPKGKANEQCARKTKRLSRAAAAACPCPQRLTGRELAVHHCTSCVTSCVSSSARAVAAQPACPLSATSLPFTCTRDRYGTRRSCAAPAPPPHRSRVAAAPLLHHRRAAPAPPPCRSRAAIVSFRGACPQCHRHGSVWVASCREA